MNRDGEIKCVTMADATTPEPAWPCRTTRAGKCGTAAFSISPVSTATARHPRYIIGITEALADANSNPNTAVLGRNGMKITPGVTAILTPTPV